MERSRITRKLDVDTFYQTYSNYVLWLLDHLPIHNPKLSSMIPQQYPVRLVVGKNFFNSKKMLQGKMYHLTAWPTYENTPPISYHKMFRQQLQLRPAEGKQGKKYLPFLKFTSRCCLFTKFLSSHEIWTLFGGIASKTSSIFFHT